MTEKIESDMMDLQNMSDSHIQKITALEKQLEKKEECISRLEYKTNELEQCSRRSYVRIFGVKEEKNENTDDIIISVAKKMNVDLRLEQIDRSHRVGRLPQDIQEVVASLLNCPRIA